MEDLRSWQMVWREGFAPQIKTSTLVALKDAVMSDDPRLSQGCTTSPPPMMSVADYPVCAACAIAFCGVVENGGFTHPDEWDGPTGPHAKIGKVEEVFAEMCFKADQLMGEPAACRWFLNWFDDTPRDTMRREFLAELNLTLNEREKADGRVSPAVPGPAA